MKATKDTQDPSGTGKIRPRSDSPLFTDSQAANLRRLLQEPVMSRLNRARRRLQQGSLKFETGKAKRDREEAELLRALSQALSQVAKPKISSNGYASIIRN